MATRHTCYDEGFKKALVSLYNNGKHRPFSVKGIAFFTPTHRPTDAIHKIYFLHDINLLCKVLGVNRIIYYKISALNLLQELRKARISSVTLFRYTLIMTHALVLIRSHKYHVSIYSLHILV